jgi:Trk K+ transport system NAD-binding subunit
VIGQTVARLQTLIPVGVKFMGLHRQEELMMPPDPATVISDTDLILVWGRHGRLVELER